MREDEQLTVAGLIELLATLPPDAPVATAVCGPGPDGGFVGQRAANYVAMVAGSAVIGNYEV